MPKSHNELFRPSLRKIAPAVWLIAGIFLVHAFFRVGGIWNVLFIPLSMVIVWPIPWIFSDRQARKSMGFKAPKSQYWFFLGPLYALSALVVCTGIAWLVFGSTADNWMVQHAFYLNEVLLQVPSNTSAFTLFAIVTLPALIFSPIAEEFLFRGYMISGFSQKWGVQIALCIQAFAFALVHLVHYGLVPFQPLLIAIWFPSMFFVSLVFGWIVLKSGSIWIAVLSHGFFNIGMNGFVFLFLPEIIGV